MLFDVESAIEEEGGHRLHNAGLLDARQCEYELLSGLVLELSAFGRQGAEV